MNADGSDLKPLRSGSQFDDVITSSPAFSPDGERIAFLALEQGSKSRVVWTMNAEGSDAGPLRDRPLTGLSFSRPAYSPDGTRIAFVGKYARIHIMNADGTGQMELSRAGLTDTDPAWSPVSDRSP